LSATPTSRLGKSGDKSPHSKKAKHALRKRFFLQPERFPLPEKSSALPGECFSRLILSSARLIFSLALPIFSLALPKKCFPQQGKRKFFPSL